MALESSFLNITRGNRISSYMGLQMDPEKQFVYAQDYTYVEVPIAGFWNPTDEKLSNKALRNQHIRVLPACRVNPRGQHYKLEVEPNPALAEFGSVQAGYYLNPGSGECIPGFWITLRKDLTTEDMGYCIRIYMRV